MQLYIYLMFDNLDTAILRMRELETYTTNTILFRIFKWIFYPRALFVRDFKLKINKLQFAYHKKHSAPLWKIIKNSKKNEINWRTLQNTINPLLHKSLRFFSLSMQGLFKREHSVPKMIYSCMYFTKISSNFTKFLWNTGINQFHEQKFPPICK